MTREDIKNEIIALKGNNFLFELPTGTGKTAVAIEKIKSLGINTLLIVVPRNVLKKNWADEIDKWWPKCNIDITYTTYVSFPKYAGKWDAICFDEAHHLSERCREAICDFNVKYNILLSATVGRNMKDELKEVFDNLVVYKKDLRNVIESNILPDPRVYLWPLKLNDGFPTEAIWKNTKSKKRLIECSYAERWSYIKQKEYPVKVYCNESQYHSDLCGQIEWWKKKYMRCRTQLAKNKWLKLCGDRLKWLSDKKTKHILTLLPSLMQYRTLTFCNSIEQTEVLGEYCINSKNKSSLKHLSDFNEGRIDHITACNVLNEGVNLRNCQVGVFAVINSSEVMVLQKTGRLLRHKEPVLIIPYYKGTREEELVNKMLENYNKELVTTINNINEIKI